MLRHLGVLPIVEIPEMVGVPYRDSMSEETVMDNVDAWCPSLR